MIDLYLSYDNFLLYQGDCCQVMYKLDTNSVDMIFSDPPYFLSSGKGTVKIEGRYINFDKGEWDRVRSNEQIHEFNIKWLKECKRVLKPSGTIWVSGTYHNIFDVASCLRELNFKILNVIVWQKSDPPTTLSHQRFNFSAEYIIWARCEEKSQHYFNYELIKSLNGGVQMPDVWRLPSVGMWEKKCGKHPTQKPLKLLYRIILASTKEGEIVLDPFAGSCTTGVAANLLNRKFIGIEQSEKFLKLGIRRRNEIDDSVVASNIFQKMSQNTEGATVLVNHAKESTRKLMIEKGICYIRAGESKGSLQVTPGFEKMQYVLLHTNGNNAQLFKLCKVGTFQIWTKETLEEYGFLPEHAKYYIVLHFLPKPIDFSKTFNLKQRINTYRSKLRPFSDFIDIK